MNGNLENKGIPEGCNPLAPALAPGRTGCVHDGGVLSPHLAPSGGVQPATGPLGLHLAPCTPCNTTNPDPLAPAGLVRFLLGKAASDTLAAAGDCFILQACPSPQPEHGGRFVMLALPVPKETADACARVAMGKAKAVRIRQTVDMAASVTAGS
jgi:hypothetical protein